MSQQEILGSDTVETAVGTKVESNFDELYPIKTEVETARGGQTDLDSRLDNIEASVAAATGSGLTIDSGDLAGYGESKLLGTSGQITVTKGGGATSRTLTWSMPDEYLKKHFLL